MRKYLFAFMFMAIASTFLHGVENRKPKIKVLLTAAIIEENYEERKYQYITNINKLKRYGCDVYIVESCQEGPTFLDDFCDHVVYTKSNNPLLTKSANEGISMSIGLKQFNFSPDEMIIKATGRYVLKTEEFIRMVRAHPQKDIIARVWVFSESGCDAYTGVYAIRAKYLDDFLTNNYLNLITQPKHEFYAIEHGLGDYIYKMQNDLDILYWPKLYDYLPEACGRH